jgi:ubiquinone/menaquinone biosynthesis C-methylase UbiE
MLPDVSNDWISSSEGGCMASFPQRAGNLLRRTKSRPLTPSERLNIPDSGLFTLPPVSVVPSLEAFIVSPTSPAYDKARALQAERFARASMPGAKRSSSQKPSLQDTVYLGIRRRDSEQPDSIVATAGLELAPVGTIQSMVQFQPGSLSEQIVEKGTFAVIRGLALQFSLEWGEILDILDTIAATYIRICERLGIERLMAVPRRPAMSLMRAEIHGLLPPYRFAPCNDVVGWVEHGVGLDEIRELRLKELSVSPDTLPLIYQITVAFLAEDITKRLSLLEQRHQTPDLTGLLRAAMRQANRQVHMDLDLLNSQRRLAEGNHQDAQETTMKVFSKKTSRPLGTTLSTSTIAKATEMTTDQKAASGDRQGFLPFAASTEFEANYLRQVVEHGGATIQRYKTLSYDLLQIEPGMQVLDVGCGIGVDLPALSDRVGEDGLVIGLDHNHELLRSAKEAISGRFNSRVVAAEAQEMPFPNRSFDCVRADRLLQHIPEPAPALAEMWRVLRPGGTLTLVEPDWKMVALFPGSPAGGNDDHTLNAILAYKQRESAHALIGRQFYSLLHQQGSDAWENVKVQVEVLALTSWPAVDAALLLSQMAHALAEEEPAMKDEINAWLKAVEIAAQRGEFLASMQLFFACARRASPRT